jgi:hypothetical protein
VLDVIPDDPGQQGTHTSPIMSREDAEKDASTIDEARREQTDIELLG